MGKYDRVLEWHKEKDKKKAKEILNGIQKANEKEQEQTTVQKNVRVSQTK